MTPVSIDMITESYAISLVTISRQTSYDSSILCQECGIIRDLPMNYMGHHLGSTFTGTDQNGAGLINVSDQTVRAMHSWLLSVTCFVCMYMVFSSIVS